MFKTNKDNKGVTLLELMITLAIIGITLTIAIPSYLSYLPHLRLRAAARDIATCLNAARMKAIARNTSCTVTFDDVNDAYTNDFGDAAYTSSNRDWTDKIDIWQGTGVVKYSAQPYIHNDVGAIDGKVTYSSYGVPSNLNTANTDYAIYLKSKPFTAGGEEYRVKVSRLTGRVTVESWSASGAAWGE